MHLAQPFQNDGIPRLVFTINTDANATGTGVPGSAWYVAMRIVNGATTTYKGVHMAFTNPTTPTFESYTPGANNSGGVDGRFVEAGSQMPAEAGSNYDGPNGKITIIVKASDLGLNPGDTISGFIAGVSQSTDPLNIGAGATALYDQMPDSLSFANSYTVGFNSVCAATPVGVVSRKTHGSVGVFDINLPLLEARESNVAQVEKITLIHSCLPLLPTSASRALQLSCREARTSPEPRSGRT